MVYRGNFHQIAYLFRVKFVKRLRFVIFSFYVFIVQKTIMDSLCCAHIYVEEHENKLNKCIYILIAFVYCKLNSIYAISLMYRYRDINIKLMILTI